MNDERLVGAAASGRADEIERFVRETLDQPDADQRTLLHLAAGHGRADVVRTLVRRGAALDLGDQDGKTAMHVAAEHGHAHVVETLARLGSRALRTTAGWTPMKLAARNGHGRVVETLFRLKPKLLDGCQPWNTPMHAAVQGGHADVLEQLHWYGSKALNRLQLADADASVVESAVRLGCTALDTSSEEHGWSPLCAAIYRGDVASAELLVFAGVHPPAHLPASMRHLSALPAERLHALQVRVHFSQSLLRRLLAELARHWAASVRRGQRRRKQRRRSQQ